jgi:hypothetical protein
MSTPITPIAPNIRAPSTALLERNNILQQILEHVSDFQDQFPTVDYEALKRDVLLPVLQARFDPEVQIRGFLRTFEHTPAFQTAFQEIKSPELQSQILAFIAGGKSQEVVAQNGFRVLTHPSGPVKHHFSLLTELKKIVLKGLHLKDTIHDAFHADAIDSHLKNLPIVYEDDANKKVMEVSISFLMI